MGRNASGKSNVLDALSLLALLADERDVSDLERGDQEVAGLRGGLSGAAPFGGSQVIVGCHIRASSGELLEFVVSLDAGPRPEISWERLTLHRASGRRTELVETERKEAGGGITDVVTYSGAAPKSYTMLSSRLAVAQVATKVPRDTKARQELTARCEDVISALRGIFVLDPVPAQMRQYVRIGSPPDRLGSTVSALAYELRENADAWERLNELLSGLVETQLKGITFSEGRLPDTRLVDVMVALTERAGEHEYVSPATVMSDGTLRYLAIVSSMLSLSTEKSTLLNPASRTLVVEEIENGLFPSQADQVLALLKGEAREQNVRLIATTHSPALLDALQPEDHQGVVICDRGADGWSRLRELRSHPRYVDLAGGGAVGREITRGTLAEAPERIRRPVSELFSE